MTTTTTNETTKVAYNDGTIAAALATMHPAIEAQFTARVQACWKALQNVEAFAKDPYDAGSSWTHYQYLAVVRPFIKGIREAGKPDFFPPSSYVLDESKIPAAAKAYAIAATAEWNAKFVAKVGNLTDAVLIYGRGVWMQIAGKRGARNVEIDQQMIVNVSSKGKMFNQFPARIKVDGKGISEAKFKKLD